MTEQSVPFISRSEVHHDAASSVTEAVCDLSASRSDALHDWAAHTESEWLYGSHPCGAAECGVLDPRCPNQQRLSVCEQSDRQRSAGPSQPGDRTATQLTCGRSERRRLWSCTPRSARQRQADRCDRGATTQHSMFPAHMRAFAELHGVQHV
jgi:hypothetical protein